MLYWGHEKGLRGSAVLGHEEGLRVVLYWGSAVLDMRRD